MYARVLKDIGRRGADLIGSRTETEAYVDIVTERFRLLRTHAWSEEVLHDLLERSRRGRRQA